MDVEQEKFHFWVGAGIITVAVVFTLSLVAGGLLLFCGPIERLGNFGDFFGFSGAVVSAIGFGAVIYQLQRQHKDAKDAEMRYREERETQQKETKETEERHKQILSAQQKLFEQNVKVALFEKRYEVYHAIFKLFERFSNPPLDEKIILEIRHLELRSNFLFSDQIITATFSRFTEKCIDMLPVINAYEATPHDSPDWYKYGAQARSLQIELSSLSLELNHAMARHLTLAFGKEIENLATQSNLQQSLPVSSESSSHPFHAGSADDN